MNLQIPLANVALQTAYLQPLLAMVALVFVSFLVLVVRRITELQRRGIDPQQLDRRTATAAIVEDSRASDHFANIFEVPVLFYPLCIVLMLGAGPESAWMLYGCWAFVALRALQAVTHLTFNRVMTRFYCFFSSSLVLFALYGAVILRQI